MAEDLRSGSADETAAEFARDDSVSAGDPPCPLCGIAMSERYAEVVAEETGARFRVTVCPRCGLGQTRPQPIAMDRYYAPGYYGGRHGATARLCVRRRLRLVRKWLGPGAGRGLLDYGSGDSLFLRAVREGGWDAWGVERHCPPAAPGAPPVVSDLAELVGHRPFACATFWHVLEHLDDPVRVLARLRSILAPGAVVLVAVPNFASWQSRLTGPAWLHLDLPRHRHHFTASSLTATLAASGLRVEQVSYGELEYDVIGWSQSLLNCVLRDRNEFFKAMSGRPTRRTGLARGWGVLVGLGLSALTTVPAWAESRLRHGGTLLAAARAGSTTGAGGDAWPGGGRRPVPPTGLASRGPLEIE